MLLFLVLCPIVAAILILAGTPARFTALIAAGANLLVAVLAFSFFEWWEHSFQFVSSFLVSVDWRIHFALGLDGLSLVLVLLAVIVTLQAPTPEQATWPTSCWFPAIIPPPPAPS